AAPPPPSASNVELPVDEVPNGEDQAVDSASDASSDATSDVEGTEQGDATGEASSDGADVAERMAELERRLEATQELVTRQRPLVTVGGYIDAGFFATQGDGTGIYQDVGPRSTRYFPQYFDHYSWVFLGDLLAPAINSRGEAADLGNLPNVDRFDSVHSGGAPGFILNEVNLTLNAAVADNALVTASMDF